MKAPGFVLLLGLSSLAAAQPRFLPPQNVGCPRDQLTSYTGKVTAYSRTASEIRLAIDTDDDTTEKFVMKAPFRMLFQREPFRDGDWAKIEEKQGRLKSGVRATMWVCEGGSQLLDWQPPRENR